jgi:hypothetical protein
MPKSVGILLSVLAAPLTLIALELLFNKRVNVVVIALAFAISLTTVILREVISKRRKRT